MDLVPIVDALYHARCLVALKIKGLAREHVGYITQALTEVLREAGEDPGATALEADELKMRLMGTMPVDAQLSRLEPCLESTADANGSDVFRELGRFHEFCLRMRFAKPENPLLQDDPVVPVYAWCRRDGRGPAHDIQGAAKLYVQWTSETHTHELSEWKVQI
jgi:hypothetical protein